MSAWAIAAYLLGALGFSAFLGVGMLFFICRENFQAEEDSWYHEQED